MDKSKKQISPKQKKKANPATVLFKDDKTIINVNGEVAQNVYGDTKAFADMILVQLVTSITKSDETKANGAISMFHGINPKDSIERLLVAQMVAVHNQAMECSARAMMSDQTIEGVERNINRATKLNRTFISQVEVLNKYRTGGQQTIQVQHVNVNEGGQAVVGNIQGGGGNG